MLEPKPHFEQIPLETIKHLIVEGPRQTETEKKPIEINRKNGAKTPKGANS